MIQQIITEKVFSYKYADLLPIFKYYYDSDPNAITTFFSRVSVLELKLDAELFKLFKFIFTDVNYDADANYNTVETTTDDNRKLFNNIFRSENFLHMRMENFTSENFRNVNFMNENTGESIVFYNILLAEMVFHTNEIQTDQKEIDMFIEIFNHIYTPTYWIPAEFIIFDLDIWTIDHIKLINLDYRYKINSLVLNKKRNKMAKIKDYIEQLSAQYINTQPLPSLFKSTLETLSSSLYHNPENWKCDDTFIILSFTQQNYKKEDYKKKEGTYISAIEFAVKLSLASNKLVTIPLICYDGWRIEHFNKLNYSPNMIFNIITSNPYPTNAYTKTICDDIIKFIKESENPVDYLNLFNTKIYEKYTTNSYDTQHFKLSDIEYINEEIVKLRSDKKNEVTPIFTINDLKRTMVSLQQLIEFNNDHNLNPIIMKEKITLQNI